MRTLRKRHVEAAEGPASGPTPLELLLSGKAGFATEPDAGAARPLREEREMSDRNTRWIDVSGWSLEQVHDALASHARDGWELARVIEASTGEMVLCLILREVA